MEWIMWLVIGGITALIAHSVMRSRMGLNTDIIMGVLGGLAGGFLYTLVRQPEATGFNLWSTFVALIGALIFLAAPRLIGGDPHISY